MIKIPYIHVPAVNPITKPKKVIRYATIIDEEEQPPEVKTERRKRPTRRTSSKCMKQIVNRRVSSDRRKASFNEKA